MRSMIIANALAGPPRCQQSNKLFASSSLYQAQFYLVLQHPAFICDFRGGLAATKLNFLNQLKDCFGHVDLLI